MAGEQSKSAFAWLCDPLTELFGLDRRVAVATVAGVGLAMAFAVFYFLHSAPPMSITVTSGRQGSSFYKAAEKYAAILKLSHVEVRILTSEGAGENLKRLADPAYRVDVGLVGGGAAQDEHTAKIVSLGSVDYHPLLVIYRARLPVRILSQFAGRRLAIGPEGSGTRLLALALLADNGIIPGGATKLDASEPKDATRALLAGRVDAVFLMGDSAPAEVIRELLHDHELRIYNFTQADAYVRRHSYLNKMLLPRGALDLGKDIPAADVNLVGPTVELVARPDLDSALTELLLDAARQVHGSAGLFRKQGEFPSPQEHEFRLSPAAARFYASGKSFFYRFLPFWVASLVNRALFSLVPLLMILVPGLRLIPAALSWSMNLIIYRWYRMLLKVEHEARADLTQEKRDALFVQLDRIEANAMKAPISYATEFYELRGHIDFVRDQVKAALPPRA